MTPEQIRALQELLQTERVLALSVVVQGEPYVGLLPYAVAPDFGSALVHASALATHTKGLSQGSPFAVLIHEPDRADADPLQVPRVTLQGTVELLARGSDEYATGQRLYLQRFPSSEPTFTLDDFNLYQLRFEKGRYVGGFAQAVNITPHDLKQLA